MEFVAMIMVLIVLGTNLPISYSIRTPSHTLIHSKPVQASEKSNRTGFIFPLLHRNHPEVAKHFGEILEVSPIEKKIDQSLYYANFLVGSEAESVFAVFDTGSGFTFLHTRNKSSSTYKSLPCNDENNDVCSKVPGHDCDGSSQCVFNTRYAGTTFVSGSVGTDTFYFFDPTETGHDADPNNAVRIDAVFGTTNDRIQYSGVLGVTGSSLGILTGLADIAFSSCFPKFDNQASYLRLGTDAVLDGETTPLVVVNPDHFGFDVDSITVGEVELTNLTSEAGRQGGTFMFDTGSAVTHLHPVAMDVVLDSVRNSIDAVPTSNRYELCYEPADKPAYSELVFSVNLSGGGSLDFDFTNLWVSYGDYNCLAFLRSMSDETRFGVRQMQGWNIGIDFDEEQIYFDVDDCSPDN